MVFKILFPDTIHFHERNFASLMQFTKTKDYKQIFCTDHNSLKKMYGNYRELEHLFYNEMSLLINKDKNELFNFRYRGTRLFPLIKAELLSFLICQDNWLQGNVSPEDSFVFDKAFLENKNDLLLNMAVGIFWHNYWKEIWVTKGCKACCIYSGSLIYNKTLINLLQNSPTRVFLLESFYTGNDYYLEEKYDHLANNSDIKFKNVFNNYKEIYEDQNVVDLQKDQIKAINKLRLANNKNVKQPKVKNKNIFNNLTPTILILGQVVNDFSLLETDLKNINSVQFYKDIINTIIYKTDLNVIFKSHPWEFQKENIKRPLTKELLTDFINENFDDNQKERIKIVENYNLEELMHQSKFVLGLCSQSLLEATALGKKTIQFGNAFFGNYGFTHDCQNIEEIISIVNDPDNNGNLSIDGYQNFILFATILLQYHLVSKFKSGMRLIRSRLKEETVINLVDKKEINNKLMVSYATRKKGYSLKDYQKDSDEDEIFDRSLSKKAVEAIMLLTLSDKKLKKFARDRESFFSDSKSKFIKLLGKFYLK